MWLDLNMNSCAIHLSQQRPDEPVPNHYELALPHTYIDAAALPDAFNWGGKYLAATCLL
jgi:hypothetical protein